MVLKCVSFFPAVRWEGWWEQEGKGLQWCAGGSDYALIMPGTQLESLQALVKGFYQIS